jgi:hypothetical protein
MQIEAKTMLETQTYETGKSAELNGRERRGQARHPFTVTVEAVEPKSKTRIQGRTSDLSRAGCYVDTTTSFPAGSIVEVRLVKGMRSFEGKAEVVYSSAGMGMGIRFKSTDPQQLRLLDQWIEELSGQFVPESEIPQVQEESCAREKPNNDEQLVLKELLQALMQRGVLPDSKCKALLQKLDRSKYGGSNPVMRESEFV